MSPLPEIIPRKMEGVVLIGHGGLDKLVWRDDLAVPEPGPGEVLIRVAAAAVNNTDINTRIAWYSKAVRDDTGKGAAGGFADADTADSSWDGAAIAFPRIQGADCCGRIVAVGKGVDAARIGERVLVRPLQTTGAGNTPLAIQTFGSECDGGFAAYTKTFSADAVRVDCDWTDLELASMPCAYTTAEGMLQRAGVAAERVLITGASGGVGAAAVQLAKRRGAHVTAMTNAAKAAQVRGLGADDIVERDGALGQDTFDVVVDLVAGPRFAELLDALERGGRYVTAGAIAGPIVELDVRTLYLRDLTLFGSTYQPASILNDLIGYIERNEIRPTVAEVFPLKDLRAAQEAFLDKRHVGKIAIDVASANA